MPRRKKKSKAVADSEVDGRKRWFGEYRCSECNRYWASAWCWDGFGQKCISCNLEVQPFRKRPLLRKKNKEHKKPHLTDLCGKCIFLGRSCGT